MAAERAQRNALARALLTAGSEPRDEAARDDIDAAVDNAFDQALAALPVPPPPDALPVLLLETTTTPPALFEEGWVPGVQTPKPEPASIAPPPLDLESPLEPAHRSEAPPAQASAVESLPPALGAPEDSIPPALGGSSDFVPPALLDNDSVIPPALGGSTDSVPPALRGSESSLPPALGGATDSVPPALRGSDSSIPPALGGASDSLPPALGSAGEAPASTPLYAMPSEPPLPTTRSRTVRMIHWLEDVQDFVGDPLRWTRRWATLRVEQLSPPRVRRRLTGSETFDREWAVFLLWVVDTIEHLLGRKS